MIFSSLSLMYLWPRTTVMISKWFQFFIHKGWSEVRLQKHFVYICFYIFFKQCTYVFHSKLIWKFIININKINNPALHCSLYLLFAQHLFIPIKHGVLASKAFSTNGRYVCMCRADETEQTSQPMGWSCLGPYLLDHSIWIDQ